MEIDSQLVINVKELNCEESLKELINKHSRLCYDVFKKYSPALRASGVYPDDVIDEKDYIIYKSALSFNPSKKTKFSTWLGNQVRYACLNKINKTRHHVHMEEFELDYVYEKNNEKNLEDFLFETKDYVICILEQMKDSRIKKIFELRYFSGSRKCMPWIKIGQNMKISSQTAINLHNKGKKTLLQKMNQEYKSDFI
jgi:RNA polymerase sigma factor (sigma-70 family)|tara:strand:- start:15902 stop:16492 length:591 start_codon:yes stop_codon:yes gene_type:complete